MCRTTEVGVAQYLHTENYSHDLENHCVPILDYFDDPTDDRYGYLVMPLLRFFDHPAFAFISEVVDFIHQTLMV